MFKFIKRYISSVIFALIILPIAMVWFILWSSKELVVRLLTWNTKEKLTFEEKLVVIDEAASKLKGLITEAAIKNGELK